MISCPLTTSCGGTRRTGLLAKIKGKRTPPAVNQPADCITENYALRRATNFFEMHRILQNGGGQYNCIQCNVTEN